LCTAAFGEHAFAATWLATMASVSGRRPKGVVEVFVCIFFTLLQAKKNCSPKRRPNS
jgi:hypothetical protein